MSRTDNGIRHTNHSVRNSLDIALPQGSQSRLLPSFFTSVHFTSAIKAAEPFVKEELPET